MTQDLVRDTVRYMGHVWDQDVIWGQRLDREWAQSLRSFDDRYPSQKCFEGRNTLGAPLWKCIWGGLADATGEEFMVPFADNSAGRVKNQIRECIWTQIKNSEIRT